MVIQVIFNGKIGNGFQNINYILWMINELNKYWRSILFVFKYEYDQVKYYFLLFKLIYNNKYIYK